MMMLSKRAETILEDLLLYSDLQENVDIKAFTRESMIEFALLTMKLMFNSPPMLANVMVLSIALSIFEDKDNDGSESYEFID